LRRINSPVIVPATDTRRADAATRAWINDIFRYLDIDRSWPSRWERAFLYLAARAFPDFCLIQSAPVGRRKTTATKQKLLSKFEAYRTRKRGSKYKHFLADHAAVCSKAGVRTIKGLKEAILKAKRERKIDQSPLDLFLAQMALPQSPTKSTAK
jgi:hypothetical protein